MYDSFRKTKAGHFNSGYDGKVTFYYFEIFGRVSEFSSFKNMLQDIKGTPIDAIQEKKIANLAKNGSVMAIKNLVVSSKSETINIAQSSRPDQKHIKNGCCNEI